MMMKKSTLLSIDAFSKTEEDVRIRTKSGGIITLTCVLITCFLLVNEWIQFNSIVIRPDLVVDRDRQLKLDISLDVTFPSVPCGLLNLDLMDKAGELELNILESGFTKTRLDSHGNSVHDAETFKPGGEQKGTSEIDITDPDYCGSCYGALDQGRNAELPRESKLCCQTCEEVRNAYLDAEWAFYDGKDIEQCEREGYVEKINEQLSEGCRVQGEALLNRIEGAIHFSPGRGYENKHGHFHDLSLYWKNPQLNFNHVINHLSFGKSVETKAKGRVSAASTAPLDGREVAPERDTHKHQFSYFAKIVPTRYEYLDKMVVETAQFSASVHDRPLMGGLDRDHPNTIHQVGGTPGVYVYFEMSPLKVINREQHAQTWSTFLLNCITSIGGVLAVGTVMDKVLYKAQTSIWGKKSQ